MGVAIRSNVYRGLLAFLGTAAVALACGGNKAPPPAPPPPPPPEPAPPPPPPPPKCEAITEACVAAGNIKATIVKSDWIFEPPSGWTYAQEADATVGILGEASLAVVVYTPEPKKETASWEKAVTEVAAKLEVSMVKKKVTMPKKPAIVKPVGALKVNLYQFDGATHGSRKGPLLVFSTDLPGGKVLLGEGFVPEDDTTKADEAILHAIESIAQAPPPAADAVPAAAASAASGAAPAGSAAPAAAPASSGSAAPAPAGALPAKP